MGMSEQEPVKMGHGVGNIGKIDPTGEKTDVKMGPQGGVTGGTKLTPMTAGVGKLPAGNTSSAVPSAPLDGLHNVGKIDGKDLSSPGSGGGESNRKRAEGMTYDYPGL